MTANRDELIRPTARRYREVKLPINGISVRVQNLTERERGEYETHLTTKKGDLNVDRLKYAKCKLITMAVVDEKGARMLTGDDVPALLDWDSADVSALWAGIREHCGFDEGDLEELVGNSEATAD